MSFFYEYPEILKFYQLYYPILIVDEYQDTNILNFMLVETLITPETRIILFGDPLQRIYGFLGAVPNIMSISKEKFNMELFKLKTNHRFENENMLLLDKNLRKHAKNLNNPSITEDAIIKCIASDDQQSEAKNILNKIKYLSGEGEKKLQYYVG